MASILGGRDSVEPRRLGSTESRPPIDVIIRASNQDAVMGRKTLPIYDALCQENRNLVQRIFREISAYPPRRRLRWFCPSQPIPRRGFRSFSDYPLSPRGRGLSPLVFSSWAIVTVSAQPSIRDRSPSERRHEMYAIGAAIHPNGVAMGALPGAQPGSPFLPSQSPNSAMSFIPFYSLGNLLFIS